MQYTKYFSFIVKENGQPQMTSEAFRRLMNIVYLEGVISGLKKVKEVNKGTDAFYKYDVAIFREQTKLTEITGNVEPSELLERMLSYT